MRITTAHLQAIVDRINRITSSPLTPYTQVDGRNVANIGNYHLSGAYGGHSLCRMQTDSGGLRDVFGCGHIPKSQLADRMHAFMAGYDASAIAKNCLNLGQA